MAKVLYDYGDGSWNDPVRWKPLCIRCNMLEEDCRAPRSPDPERMTLLVDRKIHPTNSSPTTVLGVIDYSHWTNDKFATLQNHMNAKPKKKPKKRKKKLFRRKKEASQVLQTEEPLNVKSEEKADFLKLR